MCGTYNMPRKKSIPKKFAGKTFTPSKFNKKLPAKKTFTFEKVKKVENALLTVLRLLKPLKKEKPIPKAHFNYEVEKKDGSEKE